jgi:tetratricopeptide (TPR) repeat protein
MKRIALAAAWLLAACVCFADDPPAPPVAAPGPSTCPPGAHSSALDAARGAMERDERALEPRLKFADALLAQGCYAEAVHVLEEGEAFHPRNGGIQSHLRDARSMLSEQRYFDGLDRAAETAKNERNLLRCRQLGDLAACDDALKVKPSDAGVVAAKADALVKASRVAEAIPVYRRALELNPSDAGLQSKARDAETKRQAAASDCLNGQGETALQSCQVAQLHGSGEEFGLQVRKALLLQSMDRPAQALDAYIAASVLKPGDPAVARGIVALTESTGRNDALTLSARGNALLTLGRGREALAALKQAQQLSPSLPDVKLHLAAAEKLAKAEARKREADAAVAAKLQAELANATPAPAPPPPAQPEARKYSNQGPATRSN